MKVGIFCNKSLKKYLPVQEELFRVLKERGIHYDVCENVDDAEDIDVLIVLGGDGTMLKVATAVGKKGIKILGINSGNLGFLTEFEGDETESAVELLQGDYRSQKKGVLQVCVNGQNFFALNEVFFQRRYNEDADNNVVSVTALIDGKKVDDFVGDGIIVATPTGSTAYSLSAGGPILTPDIHAFILTPVCAHSLHNRPIVYSDESVMQVRLTDEEGKISLFCDGKFICVISQKDTVFIKKAEFQAEFVAGQNNFFDKLLFKLNKWSN